MLKQQNIAIADSNIALLGSDIEKKIREQASNGEPAWKTAGQKTGIEIWRIKQFKLEAVPEKIHGQFYEGDSYIVLKTVITDSGASWDVYFWLGTHTTQDEAGTAAYKTVELDDHLKGAPIQHREVEGYESDQFLELFSKKGGIRLLKGGFESGFQHVKPESYQPRLLQVHGTTSKNIRVIEVPLAASSLNSSDVFILDAGLKIYQFNGSKAKPMEKNKGSVLANSIKDERENGSDVDVFDENDSDATPFWAFFGGKQAIAAETSTATVAPFEKSLHRLSDASGKVTFSKVSSGKLEKSALQGNDVFILDAGFHVFLWIGSNSSNTERKTALQYAIEYLKQNNRPNYLPITRIFQGGENEVFNAQFN